MSVSGLEGRLATDSDGGRFFTGQTVDRGVGRGPFTTDADARWDVQVIDINTIMDDVLLRGTDCNRPAETDVQRMQWLITDFLTGARLPPSATTTSPRPTPRTWTRRTTASRASTRAAWPTSAPRTAARTGTSSTTSASPTSSRSGTAARPHTTRTCAYSISSVLDDIDDYGVTWPAEWPEESGMQRDPSRVYSGVQVVYGTGQPGAYVSRAGDRHGLQAPRGRPLRRERQDRDAAPSSSASTTSTPPRRRTSPSRSR